MTTVKGLIILIAVAIYSYLLFQNDCKNYYNGNMTTTCNQDIKSSITQNNK